MYRERPSHLPGAVVWTARTEGPAPGRILPDGCMDLIWFGDHLVVAGPDTAAEVGPDRPGTTFTGIRFAPGTAPALLGVPADALRDQRVPLVDLRPAAEVRAAEDRVASAGCPGRALESVAATWVRTAPPADALVAEVVRRAAAGEQVGAIARAVGLGSRQLHRRCLGAIGYGPKLLARVLRLQRAVGLAGTGMPLAAVAATAGYADQPHLARDVHSLAGTTLGELLAPATA